MRLFQQLSLLFGLSAISYAGTSIVDTLKVAERVLYSVIGSHITENATTLCLNYPNGGELVLPDPLTRPKVLNTLFTLKDYIIVGDTNSTFGVEFDPNEQPYVTYVNDDEFRVLLGNLLTDRNQYVRLQYNSFNYSNSNSFVIMNYLDTVGIVTFFDKGTTNPVIIMTDESRGDVDKMSLSVLPDVLSTGCQVL